MSTMQEALTKMKALRTPTEPEGQPEAVEAVDVSEEAPVDEVEAIEAEATETEEEAAPLEAEEENEEPIYLDLDGEEVDLNDIRKWKKGFMQEADYTRKTMALAEDRKGLNTLKDKQQAQLDDFQSHIDILADMTGAEFKDVDWDELRDLDTSEYLKLKEKQAGRQGTLDAAKAKRQELLDGQRSELTNTERKKLMDAMPHWSDSAKQEADMVLLQTYLKDKGWNDSEFNDIVNHKHVLALIDAANFHARKSKAPAATKQVRKAPVIVKGKRATATNLNKQIQDAQAKLKQTGNMRDALALKKLKRQLN